MKRFYKEVETNAEGDGWAVLLDGKSIKTPIRQTLLLPTIGLAENVVQEWQEQGDEVVPLSMPLTRYANATIDRTRAMRDDVIEQVCAFGQSDMLCYRVDEPADLVERQLAEWQPMLDWLSASRDINLSVTAGIIQIDQPPSALERVNHAVSAFDDFQLTGLHAVATGCGSIALGLALADGHIDCAETLELATLEERHQMGLWGEDPETMRRHEELGQEIFNANQFMTLAVPGARSMVAVKAMISGRVQGVWYRSWTVENAQTLGLDGWVRNRSDGTVEACFCGPAPMVQEMLSRCQTGPIASRVLSIKDEPTEPVSEIGFKQLPTL